MNEARVRPELVRWGFERSGPAREGAQERQPPDERLPVTDFRHAGTEVGGRPARYLLETLFLGQQRQKWYRAEASVLGDSLVDFVVSLDKSVDPMVRLRTCEGTQLGKEQQLRASTWNERKRRAYW